MKWFKFYGQDYLSDPKMLSLDACERSCWITLLSYSSINDNGMITHLDEYQLMIQAGVDPMADEWDMTKGILEKLVKLEMITDDNGMITVKNWQKRQETNLTSYERVKKYREKKRNDNEKITLEENRREENRRDKKSSATARVKKTTYNPLGGDILKAFEEVDPKNKTYYGHITQRKACDYLLEEYGLEEVLKRITIIPKTNKQSFFPRINSPHDLKEKWVKLNDAVANFREEKVKNKIKVII